MTQGRAGIHTMNPGGGKTEKYAYKDQRARNGKHAKTFPVGRLPPHREEDLFNPECNQGDKATTLDAISIGKAK